MEIKDMAGNVLFALESAKTILQLVTAGVEANKALRGAYLGGANLRGADLGGANLRGAYLGGANLRGAYLDGAYLDGANLGGANLSGAYLDGAYLSGADLGGANLGGAYLDGAYLDGANLRGAYLGGANLRGAYLDGAYLDGADLMDKKIAQIRVFSGLYEYEVWAVLFQDGSRLVRMGCFYKNLEDWAEIGIRQSNLAEFPDDGSERSECRVAAFEFAKAAVERMELN